jgi:hypothetical protein
MASWLVLQTLSGSPQPQARLLAGGTARGPHGPGALPCLEAPGQSSCADLGKRNERVWKFS